MLKLRAWGKKLPSAAVKKRPKFFNRKVNSETRSDGLGFDSKREARRYDELSMLQSVGKISGLRRQVRFPMDMNGQRICTYIADFTYYDLVEQKDVVEDSKNSYLAKHDRTFSLKRKLMKALYNIEIKVTA